jgi:MoaA/NifB/PqqE/SkfB family radical SAM enzyme
MVQSPEVRDAIVRACAGDGTMVTGPQGLALCMDVSCSLHCVFCRDRPYYVDVSKRKVESMAAFLQEAEPWMRQLRMDGCGEVLYSPFYRDLLAIWKIPNTVRLELFTNGHYFTENNLARLGLTRIDQLYVGCDACTAEVYAKIRRGGHFDRLPAKFSVMADWRKAGKINRLWFIFVVNALNYAQMPDYVPFARQYGATMISFTPMLGDGPVRDSLRVLSPQHPQHADLLRVLRNPVLQAPDVELRGIVREMRQKALGKPFIAADTV